MTGLTYWSVTTWQGYRFHSFKNPKQVWHHHLLTLWHHQLIADQEVKMVRSPVDLMTCLGHMRYETLPLNPTSTSSCPVLVTLAKSKHVIVILVQSWWHLQKANMSLSFWSFTGDTCKTSRSMLLCLLLERKDISQCVMTMIILCLSRVTQESRWGHCKTRDDVIDDGWQVLYYR